MRLSTSARPRHRRRPDAGAAGRTFSVRLAAGLVGLAMVGSLGVGSIVTAQAEESAAEANTSAAAATAEVPAAADAATDAGAPDAGREGAEDAAPAEAPAVEVAADDAAPTEDGTPAAPQLPPAPAAQVLAAAEQLTCDAGIVYTIGDDKKIRRVATSDGSEREIGTISSSVSLNGLALSKDGSQAYAVRSAAAPESGRFVGLKWVTYPSYMTVYRYDSTSGNTTPYDVQQGIATGGTFVMGGINPANGVYYYGRVVSSKLELYAFNTTTNTNIGLVGSVAISNDSNGNARNNGDLVFSSDGTMYFVASSGGSATNANALLQITGQVPVTAGTAVLRSSLVVNLNVKNEAFNGIAFEGGYLYLDTTKGKFYKVNASNGTIEATVASNLSSPVDMASCQYNNSLQVQKNIVDRVGAADQFTMSATANGQPIGTPGTTAGSTTGLQTSAGTFATSVPLSGTSITIREAGAAGTAMTQYTSSWICKNQAGTTIAEGDGTSGTFTFPPQTGSGVNITCVFTNQPLLRQVKVTKTWVNAAQGDTASFTANAKTGASTAPVNGDVITANFAQGTTVNVGEVLAAANKGSYTTALTCTNAAGKTVATGSLTGTFVLGDSNVNCAYTNTNTAATIVVTKKWIVDGIAYDNGRQPAGISAALTLTGPGSAGASAQPWGTVRSGYSAGNSVSIDETTTFASQLTCRLTDKKVTLANGATATADLPHAAVLAAGANSYTITNTVECTTQLTLLKFIDASNGGTLVPGDFTLSATPDTGTALHVSGANTVSAANTGPVTAGMNYTLSEASALKPAYLQLSLQRYTGTLNADGSLANPDAWSNTDQATVAVATGHHGVYRFVNASVPALALPLTGGTGSSPYLLVGGGLLLLAVLTAAWMLVRRTKSHRP